MNAWPATHHLLLDGWLIRLSNGFTKRANCVVPLYDKHTSAAANPPIPNAIQLDKIRYCENLYAREQLQTVFRLTSYTPATATTSAQPTRPTTSDSLDQLLAARGYDLLDKTHVQLLNLADRPTPTSGHAKDAHAPNAQFNLVPAPRWLREYSALAEMPASASELHAPLIRSIRPDCAFALLTVDGAVVACALGVLEHDLLGIFDVITAPQHRGAGYASSLLANLLQWGTEQGATRAYLQVTANNAPALALYERLGFENLYSYWYRQTP